MDPITAMILAAMVAAGVIVSGAKAGADVATTLRASKAGAWDFLDRRAERREAARGRLLDAWRDRRAARNRQAGGDGTVRPGAGAYFGDLYHGYWEDQLAKRAAKREARPKPVYAFDPGSGRVRRDGPVGPSVRERVSALADKADAAIVAKATAVRGSRLGRKVADHPLVRPVGEPRRDAGGPAGVSVSADPPSPDPWTFSTPVADPERPARLPEVGAPSPDLAAAHRRPGGSVVDTGRRLAAQDRAAAETLSTRAEQALNAGDWGGASAALADLQGKYPDAARGVQFHTDSGTASVLDMAREASRRAAQARDDNSESEPAAPAPISSSSNQGGTTMTAPTGEAVNYETAIAELDAQEQTWRDVLEAATATRAAAAQMKAAADQMQTVSRQAAGAAQATHDNLSARNLDGATLSHTGTAATVVDANQVDAMYEQVEALEAQADAHTVEAEAGLSSIGEARSVIVETYGDAHSTVAGNLGGDSSFLDSGAGQAGGGAVAYGGEDAAVGVGATAVHRS